MTSSLFPFDCDTSTAEIKQLRDALAAIVAIPSEQTLLLNAEARAMYEIASRALESKSVLNTEPTS